MKGPYTKYVNIAGEFENRRWFCTDEGTKRVPLPYNSSRYESQSIGTYPLGPPTSSGVPYYVEAQWCRDDAVMQTLVYKAYGRLQAQLGSFSMNAVNIMQYGMTVKLAQKLVGALVHPLTTLGKTMKRYAKNRKLTLADTPIGDISELWLMFHFGVEPTLNDLLATVQALALKQPEHKVFASASKTVVYQAFNAPDYWNNFDEIYEIHCKMACTVSVENPNVFLANQLGLINLPSIAWDLVKWSFLVDHICSIGTYLSSLTDTFGLNVVDAYTTKFCRTRGLWFYNYQGIQHGTKSYGARMERSLGIDLPRPQIHAPKLSLSHLATYAALATLAVKNLPLKYHAGQYTD
jgi:hypothetical protein